MPNMKELVEKNKSYRAQAARQPSTATKESGVKGPLTSHDKLRGHLEEKGVIQALEELKEMTGDPNARVEIVRKDKWIGKDSFAGDIYSPLLSARLVWDEHAKPDVLEVKPFGEHVITSTESGTESGQNYQETSDVTYEKIRPVEAKSVKVDVTFLDGRESKPYLDMFWDSYLADEFVSGGKTIETRRVKVEEVTKREKHEHTVEYPRTEATF